MRFIVAFAIALLGTGVAVAAMPVPATVRANKVAVEAVRHLDRPALRVTDLGGGGDNRMVTLAGPAFRDGEVRLRLTGERGPNASPTDRGFVGVAFRVSDDLEGFEGVYLRPENARADDQLRRNRTVQYHSPPDWPWNRLRAETPAKYETYADVAPGAWTELRVVVKGAVAHVYVGGAEQPTLIVHDLKRGADASGAVALWVGPGTIAHFTDVEIRPAT